jgi:lipoprotein-anchoring transpeptidase ErfK/SrfK
MKRYFFIVLVVSAVGAVSAQAEPLSLEPRRHGQTGARLIPPGDVTAPRGSRASATAESDSAMHYAASRSENNLGGGFIEFLFNGGRPITPRRPPTDVMAHNAPYAIQPETNGEPSRQAIDPQFEKQVVEYRGREKPGTIIIDTPRRFLFLVQNDGTALRYGIGVGRPGFTWAGEKKVSAKKEWPDWVPPPDMLQRRPDLPHFMAGGPENPMGARAIYLGSSLYRIHGSNEPWTIGQAVSSGCIRMRNEDVIELYERVKVGTKVVVI